jgi:hypothetical protein
MVTRASCIEKDKVLTGMEVNRRCKTEYCNLAVPFFVAKPAFITGEEGVSSQKLRDCTESIR